MTSLSLLQGIFPTQGLNTGLLHCRRIFLPSESPGKPKYTGAGSLNLLQGIFLTQESNQGHLHYRRILYRLSYQRSPLSIYFFLVYLIILIFIFTLFCFTMLHWFYTRQYVHGNAAHPLPCVHKFQSAMKLLPFIHGSSFHEVTAFLLKIFKNVLKIF